MYCSTPSPPCTVPTIVPHIWGTYELKHMFKTHLLRRKQSTSKKPTSVTYFWSLRIKGGTTHRTHCSRNTLQQTALHCDTLRHTATHCGTLRHTAAHCDTLRHTATNCDTLRHTATRCSILRDIATHWIANIIIKTPFAHDLTLHHLHIKSENTS